MIRLVIVDDEPDVIEGIRVSVDWKRLGIDVVADASNGIEGLDVVRRYKPDILLTDIRMAGADGISLIESSKRIAPDMEFIIFTGYNEFTYAKSAISLGVAEYLEKPVSVDSLEKALCKAKEKRLKVLKSQEATAEARKLIILERMRRYILGWDSNIRQKHDELQKDGIPVGKIRSGVVAVLELSASQVNSDELDRTVESVLLELACYPGWKVFVFGNEVPLAEPTEIAILVLSVCPEEKRSRYTAYFRKLWARCKRQCDVLNSVLTIGVGSSFHSFAEIRESYTTARHAARYACFSGTRRCLFDEEIDAGHSMPAIARGAQNEAILSVRAGDHKGVMSAAKLFLEQLRELQLSPDLLCHECLSFILSIFRITDETGMSYTAWKTNVSLPHQRVTELHTFDELSDWVYSTIGDILKWMRHSVASRHRAINYITDYIRACYNKDITLQELADLVGMNISYLSCLFKKETGTTYLQYLTRIRLEHSKQLIDQGMKVGTACRKVGYYDGRHFSQLFKKHFGIMPGEYAKSIRSVDLTA